MRAIHLAMTLTVIAAASCSKASKDEPAAGDHQGMVMDSGTMKGTPGMRKAGMMPMMQAHMDSMMRMSPEQMSSTLGRHERLMSEMMDQMGGEMRQMKMSETGEWSALTDSIKQDLAELPNLTGQKLQTRMHAHVERVRRLMRAHEQMMKGMH